MGFLCRILRLPESIWFWFAAHHMGINWTVVWLESNIQRFQFRGAHFSVLSNLKVNILLMTFAKWHKKRQSQCEWINVIVSTPKNRLPFAFALHRPLFIRLLRAIDYKKNDVSESKTIKRKMKAQPIELLKKKLIKIHIEIVFLQ